jgi:hypothetical protein
MEEKAQVAANLSRHHQAHQRTLPKITAVDSKDLEPQTVDVDAVYTRAGSAVVRSQAYKEQVLALANIDKEAVNNLEDYWLATGYAQTLHRIATSPVASVPVLYQKLLATREIMALDAKALGARGLLPSEKVKDLTGIVSHTTAAFDVMGFCAVFREHWDAIVGKTALQMSDIVEGETLAEQLLKAVTERGAADMDAGATNLNRWRAFTLFARAYQEVRDGIAFLRRREGDVDVIMPPLYSLRGGRRKPDDVNPSDGDTPVQPPVAPAPGNGSSVPIGHPDSSPFIS